MPLQETFGPSPSGGGQKGGTQRNIDKRVVGVEGCASIFSCGFASGRHREQLQQQQKKKKTSCHLKRTGSITYRGDSFASRPKGLLLRSLVSAVASSGTSTNGLEMFSAGPFPVTVSNGLEQTSKGLLLLGGSGRPSPADLNGLESFGGASEGLPLGLQMPRIALPLLLPHAEKRQRGRQSTQRKDEGDLVRSDGGVLKYEAEKDKARVKDRRQRREGKDAGNSATVLGPRRMTRRDK